MAHLYRHIRSDKNEVFYVGVGGLDNFDNYARAYTKKRKNTMWRYIISKTSYIVEILLDDLTKEEVFIKETEFIKLYGRKDLKTGTLTNLTDGGEGGPNKIISLETRQKISKATKGEKNPFYGRKHTKESMLNHGKLVLNLETGIFYDSMKEAYLVTSLKYKTFKAQLNGQNKNSTSFITI